MRTLLSISGKQEENQFYVAFSASHGQQLSGQQLKEVQYEHWTQWYEELINYAGCYVKTSLLSILAKIAWILLNKFFSFFQYH